MSNTPSPSGFALRGAKPRTSGCFSPGGRQALDAADEAGEGAPGVGPLRDPTAVPSSQREEAGLCLG